MSVSSHLPVQAQSLSWAKSKGMLRDEKRIRESAMDGKPQEDRFSYPWGCFLCQAQALEIMARKSG